MGGQCVCVCACAVGLHGLSAEQVSGQQGVDGGGAPDHAGVVPPGGPPQAGVLGHAPPQQVTSARLGSSPSSSSSAATAAAPLADGVRLRRPHPVLIGSWVGLPASGVGP